MLLIQRLPSKYIHHSLTMLCLKIRLGAQKYMVHIYLLFNKNCFVFEKVYLQFECVVWQTVTMAKFMNDIPEQKRQTKLIQFWLEQEGCRVVNQFQYEQ